MDANAQNTLHRACMDGDLRTIERMIAAGLTASGARVCDNLALYIACASGRVEVVERLLALGLGIADVREKNNIVLHAACTNGHHAVVKILLELGLTIDDVRALDNIALRSACEKNHCSVVCTLAAAGVIEPTGDLHAHALRQIIRESSALADVDGDEAAQRTETLQAAARAAAGWPGHEEALAKLVKISPEEAVSWDALYVKVMFGGVSFSD